MHSTQSQTERLIDEGRTSLQDVRRSLIELFASIGVDPAQPQEVARRLRLNRNLTWKLSKVVSAQDPFAALNHLPGHQGMTLATRAFREAGAPSKVIDEVDNALRRLGEVIGLHAGSRDDFELTLESMGLFTREMGQEGGRELAYRGNSMIWGVQVRTRLSAAFYGPHPGDPDRTDYVQVAGLVGFRRLRPGVRWRLLRMKIHDDTGADLSRRLGPGPLGDPDGPVGGYLLDIPGSGTAPALEMIETAQGRELILPAGPVGNQAAFDAYVGYRVPGLPLRRQDGHEFGSTAASITMPCEALILDMLVHRSIRFPRTPQFAIHGFPHGGPDDPSQQTISTQLPIHAAPVELAGSPPAVVTAAVPSYSALTDLVCRRMGWRFSEFWGVRVTVPHPPMGSLAVLRWPLAE